MANIKSQKKRIVTNEKARIRNISYKSKVRTAMKKVEAAVKAGKKDEAVALLNAATSLLDRSVVKGIFHFKTVAREKARLTNLVNSL